MRLGDLLNDRDPSLGGLAPFESTVTRAPSDTSDFVRVRLYSTEDQTDALDSGPIPWQRNGDVLPAVGTRCLVVPTINGGLWVAAFDQEA